MKKFITVLLLAVMCVSLVACTTESNAEPKLYGTWISPEDSSHKYTLVINKDKTGTLTNGGDNSETQNFTWVFDEPTRILILTNEEGEISNLTYIEANDSFTSFGVRLIRSK